MTTVQRNTKNAILGTLVAKRSYNREQDLPKLLGLWPSELNDLSKKTTGRIVQVLRKSLRMERQRGKSGHWTYDLNRHLALKSALGEEMARLRVLKREEFSLKVRVQSSSDLDNDLRLCGERNAVNQNRDVLTGVVLRIPDSIELISDADRHGDIVT